MARLLSLLLLLLLLCARTPSSARRETAPASDLFARDGFGRPVAWWAVLKLPMHVRAADGHGTRATPCDCAAPDCSNAPTAELNVTARASGLCYLYADAHSPAFQHFRTLGYDCLGQGGNDPVSHTLRQLQREDGDAADEPYWAIFNDQLNGIARAYKPHAGAEAGTSPRAGAVCGGGNVFSAHAKGAVGFHADSGGFFLETSTPNFPDPTPPARPARGGNGFVRLGCQVDNNVQFAQHMFAMSLAMPALDALGAQLQAARLCSGNFYTNVSNGLGALLASPALYRDGQDATASRNFSALYAALLDPALPSRPQASAFNLTLKPAPAKLARASVFAEPTDGQTLVELNRALAQREQAQPLPSETTVQVLVKSPQTAVPPWALVAESLESDVSVATWWDGGYGIPNVCAGDDYSRARERFCLDADAVFPNGTARFNVENLLEATWHMAPRVSAQQDVAKDALTWHLVGGNLPDGNHAKWGLTTPRDGKQDPARAAVTFADLNMQGFPCSRACNGSQAGRGGAFFSLRHPALHASVAERVVSRACRCTNAAAAAPASTAPLFSAWGPERAGDRAADAFAETRMCHFGCWRKVAAGFAADELPALAPNATSFWQA